MCPSQNGSFTSEFLNKSTESGKFRVIEREQFDDISPVLSVETLCLVGCG